MIGDQASRPSRFEIIPPFTDRGSLFTPFDFAITLLLTINYLSAVALAKADQLSTLLDAPQRSMRAELGNLAGRFFADVNGDANDANESADKDKGYQP